MKCFRLDPADPLGGVLRWLAALLEALRLDPARAREKVPLTRAAVAEVRRWLALWSRQLRGAIRAEALRLAAGIVLTSALRRRFAPPLPRRGASSNRSAEASSGVRAGRVVAVAAPPRPSPLSSRSPPGSAGSPTAHRPPGELIGDAEDAAIRRRTRAVLTALLDPSAVTARLARRLARAGAGTRARVPPLRRFSPPPRIIVLGAPIPPRAPEPRPPDRRLPSADLQHAPRPRGGGVGAGPSP